MQTLEDTSWALALAPSISAAKTYSVTFECNGVSYSGLSLSANPYTITYGSTVVFYEGWITGGTNYRIITFTGGTDIDNSELMLWIEANAEPNLSQKEIFERDMAALRSAINTKARTTGKKTIQQMTAAVNSIPEGGGGGKDHTFDIPTVSGTNTYTGSSQSPTLVGYYSDFMTKTGNTSATNAGNYTITISLKDTDNCQWRDGTTEPITLSWFINKAVLPKPTLSVARIMLDEETTTKTFTVNRLGDGVISATSSNPSKITASVSGTTVTVTAIDISEDATSSITIIVGEGTNYYAYTDTDVVCSAVLLVNKNKLIVNINTANTNFPVCLTVSSLGQFSIDWDDGNVDTPTTYTDSTYKRVSKSHTYATAGTYTIIFNIPDGVTWSPGAQVAPASAAIAYKSFSGDVGYGNGITEGIIFKGAKGLVEMLPHALEQETKIRTIELSSVTTTIGDSAITQARGTRNIILGENVSNIGKSFGGGGYNCTVNVTCYAVNPPIMNATGAFSDSGSASGVVNGTIYVPAGSVEAYKAATGWSKKASDIQAISE